MLNRDGHEFLADYLPAGVAPEAVMDEKVFPFTISNESRYIDIAIAAEIAAGRGTEHGAVQFSFAHIPPEKLAATIPNTMRWMRAKGLDPQRDLLDVGIAFQCLNGGVRMTDTNAMSTIEGLFVIGELAGGVRGPDRPGGNSLAEGQVFGLRAGAGAAAPERGAGRTRRRTARNASRTCAQAKCRLRRAAHRDRPASRDADALPRRKERDWFEAGVAGCPRGS
jgi:fumarate reductase (CoM/CoB) subunit A